LVNLKCVEAFANDKGLSQDERVKFLHHMEELQLSVNDMKKMPQYRQYVQQRKLSLLSNDFRLLDTLLTLGILE
jgi:hypothetical protein